MTEQPWDIPPFPTHGDQSERTTYAAVGHAMSRWEAIEVEFAQLYALMAGGNQFDELLSRKYGEWDNFRGRLHGLEKQASEYFVGRPDQELEAKMCRTFKSARCLSARRSDIVHSIARPFFWQVLRPQSEGVPGQPPFEWCLAPPHFRGKNFEGARPRFLLAAAQIDRFAEAFIGVQAAANNLVLRLVSQRRSSA